jgi:pyruvate dehydrogenase E2 component (dihydrolipoamide acetyltransferase)
MASEIKLPELGENLEGGDVLDIKVNPGDTVQEGQALLEIDAEKSTVEVPSPLAGQITQVLVKRGDHVLVSQPIALIEAGAAATASTAKAPARLDPRTTEAGPGNSGPTPVPGRRSNQAVIEPQGGVHRPAATTAERPPGDGLRQEEMPPAVRQGHRLVLAGPATRRLARELGVDLGRVPGSGAAGRVTQEDVKAYVRQVASGSVSRAAGLAQAPPLPDFSKWGAVERQPMDAVRRTTAAQMSLAWSLIPHVTQHDLADVTDLEAFRKRQEGSGPKLTVTAFALKAAAGALRQFPQFNASLDVAGGQVVLKRYYHIGVAVDTGRGLLVPVIRDVDRKGVRELAQELTEVAERARQKRIPIEEMRGGTFTITNLGGVGGTGFTPIVNYPEVAILGLSRARVQPVFLNGAVVPRLILPLSLTYDHRLIDGADAARFTRRMAEMLENPLLILL